MADQRKSPATESPSSLAGSQHRPGESPSSLAGSQHRHGYGQQTSRVSRASSRHGGTMSVRGATLRSQLSQPPRERTGSTWNVVKKAVKKGTLVAVGLKQTSSEKLHWQAVQRSIHASSSQLPQTPSTSGSTHTRQLQRFLSRLSYHDIPAAHIAYPFKRQPSTHSASARVGVAVSHDPGRLPSVASVHQPDGEGMVSLHPPLYGTGRVQAVRKELKPDLWKIAYKGVRRLASQSTSLGRRSVTEEKVRHVQPSLLPLKKSFVDLMGEDGSPMEAGRFLGTIQENDEDFFGAEYVEETDAAIARLSPRHAMLEITKPEPKPVHKKLRPLPKPAPKRRGRIGLPHVIHDPLFGGYDRGYGGLGLSTHLLRFKYAKVSQDVQKRLDDHLLHKRPYFTYWLMVVHFIIMITAVSVYGIAPYGWDQQEERGTVLASNLAFDTVERIIIPNVWFGPSQQSLVLLGALYGPCMRTDRQLFEAVNADRDNERDDSGCCVRLDQSGCVQELREDCPGTFTEFVHNYTDGNDVIRGVCGTSPRTCTDPRPGLNSDLWVEDNVLTWPICLRSNISEDSAASHLTCDITGRPCCVGIQALCLVTTREHCDFLEGRFHQDAFLCSQVDCLNTTCGLLPFRVFNEPDQVYRLWIALFMHAGLTHLFLSLVFSFLVLRHVEKRMGWLRTAILYIVSGIGGNLVSAYFVPYNPGVGPAGSILGVVAYMFVFLIFESRLLVRPWVEFLKLGAIVLILLILGLFPFIDNFAHIGGFVFGFLLSGILVPYHSLDDLGVKPKKKRRFLADRDIYRIIKWGMVLVGIPVVLLLFVLFFVLFYAVQDTWEGFQHVNCIPFTDTICQDLGANIRTRDSHII